MSLREVPDLSTVVTNLTRISFETCHVIGPVTHTPHAIGILSANPKGYGRELFITSEANLLSWCVRSFSLVQSAQVPMCLLKTPNRFLPLSL